MYRWDVMHAIARARLVAIVRTPSRQAARDCVAGLVAGGAPVVEVTMSVPGSLDGGEEFSGRGLMGVGTVLSQSQAVAAAERGARFIVTPNLEPEVIRHANRHGLASLVGCGTPTEILRALELGADAVKLFPASTMQPSIVRSLHGPLPRAPLVPTGGVDAGNAAAWLAAGALAVGAGGALRPGQNRESRGSHRRTDHRHQQRPGRLTEGAEPCSLREYLTSSRPTPAPTTWWRWVR